jgi:hypothetical protein
MSKAITICGTTGKECGVPLFMREGGEEVIEAKRLELEEFLQNLRYDNKEETIIINDNYKSICLTEEIACELRMRTAISFCEFMDNPNNHYVNGEKWSCGFLGSRWADTTLSNYPVRIAFYSKKYDPYSFHPTEEQKYKYKITINFDYDKWEARIRKNKEEVRKIIKEREEELLEEEEKAEEKAKKLLEELEAEPKKASPKSKKEKKPKAQKPKTNPYPEFVSIAKDIWRKNPKWVKWEKENKCLIA